MKIELNERFKLKLENQVHFIAKDKPLAAKRFRKYFLIMMRLEI